MPECAGTDLMQLPLIERRHRLEDLLHDHVTADWRGHGGPDRTATALLQLIDAGRLARARARSHLARTGRAGPVTAARPPGAAALSLIELPELPEEWAWAECGALCQPERSLTYGVIKLGPPVAGGVSTLRSSDVRHLLIDEGKIKQISPLVASEYKRTFLQGGEIVVTARGSLRGVAVVPPHMSGFNVSREVAVVPIESELDSDFMAFAIGSVWSQNWLMEAAKGVTYTGVNIEDLRRLPLPIPPIEEQHEIVRRVKNLLGLAEAAEHRVHTATVNADTLLQSIQSLPRGIGPHGGRVSPRGRTRV